MKWLKSVLPCYVIAASLSGAALPAYANGNDCLFQSKGLSLSFGTLNPGSGADVLMPVSGASTAGDCAPGQTMTIDSDNGLNFNGTRNLKSAAGDLIPYSLAGLPQSRSGPGNDNYVPFTFNGSILWSAYANASAGSYSDTVIISVTP
jgi:spore coat protein U-like protein